MLVIDASAGVTAQDRQIAGLIQKANKPCVVAINKWDLLAPPEDTPPNAVREFRQEWLANAEAELVFHFARAAGGDVGVARARKSDGCSPRLRKCAVRPTRKSARVR